VGENGIADRAGIPTGSIKKQFRLFQRVKCIHEVVSGFGDESPEFLLGIGQFFLTLIMIRVGVLQRDEVVAESRNLVVKVLENLQVLFGSFLALGEDELDPCFPFGRR